MQAPKLLIMALRDQVFEDGPPLVRGANPDLVERLRTGAALTPADRATFYGGGEKGYTDYPTLAG